MNTERIIRLFRNGRNQALRIPRELELDADEALIYADDGRLVIQPLRRKGLLATLQTLEPIDEDFADADEGMTELDAPAL
jgi:antitoxin VapB